LFFALCGYNAGVVAFKASPENITAIFHHSGKSRNPEKQAASRSSSLYETRRILVFCEL